MKARKVIVALLVIGTLSTAGIALAQGRKGQGPRPLGPQGDRPAEAQPWKEDFRPTPWMGACGCGRFGWQPAGRGPDASAPAMRPGMEQPNRRMEGPERGRFDPRGPQGNRADGCRFEGRGFGPDMPKEIRAKAVELAKLHIDLENVLTQEPLDRTRAVELHNQMGKLEQEIDAWRFEKALDHVEELHKQRELNRTVKPGLPPKGPKPAEAGETPAEEPASEAQPAE